jgi:hypothetical protein
VIEKYRQYTREIILVGSLHILNASFEALVPVKEYIVPGGHVMICTGDQGILFRTAGTDDKRQQCQEEIIYEDSLSQDNTNVLNSNEKIPAQLCRDRNIDLQVIRA